MRRLTLRRLRAMSGAPKRFSVPGYPGVVRTEYADGSVKWHNPSVPQDVNGTYRVGEVQAGLAPITRRDDA